MNAGIVGGRTVTEAGIRRNRGAGVLHQIGALRMQEITLRLAEICEVSLIDQIVADRPVVGEVPLLVALLAIGAEIQVVAPPAWKRE